MKSQWQVRATRSGGVKQSAFDDGQSPEVGRMDENASGPNFSMIRKDIERNGGSRD
jgi:hypothetical protein